MKSLLLSILILTVSSTFATNSISGTEEAEQIQLIEKVKNLVADGKLIEALGLNGEANLRFTVDENQIVHVEGVESGDFLSEYHIRKTLEGLKMEVSNSLVGKTFALAINFVQSK